MPKAVPIQTSFNSGELSEKLLGRVDTEQYRQAAEEITNFLITPYGGIESTPGTHFIGEVRDSSKVAKIFSFEFSDTDTYTLEFNDSFIRFYRNNGRVVEADVTIIGASQTSPVVISATTHGYSNGDEVVITGVVGMTELNGKSFIVANKTASTFELHDRSANPIDGSAFTAYVSGGVCQKIYEIAQPYADADLFSLKINQNADTMYITHRGYQTRKLTRTGHTSWTLAAVTFTDGPYFDENITATTLGLSATSGSVTVTASGVTGINGGDGFKTTDIGRIIRWHDGTDWHWLTITAWTSTTVVEATVEVAATAVTTATVKWRLGLWSDTTGYPRTSTFHEQRLFLGGATDSPETLAGSVTNSFEDMTPGVADTDAFTFTIAATKVNAIQDFTSTHRELIITTRGGVTVLWSGSDSLPITPTNVNIRSDTSYGAALITPKRVGNFVYYVQRDTKILRELKFSIDDEGFIAQNASILSEHLLREGSGIVDMDHQLSPYNTLWCVLSSGDLATFTRETEQNVQGWSRQETDGSFESVAVIPQATFDQVWLVVNRTINGETKRYIERVADPTFSTQADAFFVHSGITYSGAAATEMTGLEHLEGETVKVLVDGATHPDKTVASGKITLDVSGTKVQIGLSYQPKLKMLRPEAGGARGTAQGQVKTIHEIIIRLYSTLGMKVGDDDRQEEIQFREADALMDVAPVLFTGDKKIRPEGGFSEDSQVVILQDDPLPLNISAVISKMETFET